MSNWFGTKVGDVLQPQEHKIERVHPRASTASILRSPTTPTPMRGKVVERPQRDPINRQAARVIAPASWINMPPETPDLTTQELRSKLVMAENQIAAQRQELQFLHKRNEKISKKMEELEQERQKEQKQKQKLVGDITALNNQLAEANRSLKAAIDLLDC